MLTPILKLEYIKYNIYFSFLRFPPIFEVIAFIFLFAIIIFLIIRLKLIANDRKKSDISDVQQSPKNPINEENCSKKPLKQYGVRAYLGPDNRAVLYPVWYGTNRQLNSSNNGMSYTSDRNNFIHYGKCLVSIPKSHKIGSIGSPKWKRLLNGDDRLKIVNLKSLSFEDFINSVNQELKEDVEGEMVSLIYIHGYNVSFNSAAIRAAQLGYDLKIPGITAFYSWPSRADITQYMADEATIDASEKFIEKFLLNFIENTESQKIHIIAHSMGNRALIRALIHIHDKFSGVSGIPIGQIILAAPDIDSDVFMSLANYYTVLSDRTTLYTSRADNALHVSSSLHNYSRAGYIPPITITEGIDTIDASKIDWNLLGHGYYAEAREVLVDIHSLITLNAPPEQRFSLQKRKFEHKIYWELR